MNTETADKPAKPKRKIPQTERIRRLAAKGLDAKEIAKRTGVRYQTVWRTLNRANRTIVSRTKFAQADEEALECDNDLCMSGQSNVCECRCMGAFHGVLLRQA